MTSARSHLATALAVLAACTPPPPSPTAPAQPVTPPPEGAASSAEPASEPSAPEAAPVPEPVPESVKGCWETEFGSAPEGTGHSLAAPVDDCDGCEALRAGPAAAGLHPAVLRRLLEIQRGRPAPPVDEPVLWVNSGPREGKPSKSMHNQALAVDVVVCGLDSPGVAALLRDAGFTCVIEYYDAEGNACRMAHGDLRGTDDAKGAYGPGAWKSGSCPGRAVSKGEDCQNNTKADWSYSPSAG